jgi:cell division protein FtsL
MTKWRILLGFVLVVSALSLVTSQYRARRLFVDLDRAQARARALEVQWGQLQIEQREQSNSALVDSKARGALSMKSVDAARTLHLNLGDDGQVATLSNGAPR